MINGFFYVDGKNKEYACEIAAHIGCNATLTDESYISDELHLFLGKNGLELRKGELKLFGDFTVMKKRLMYNNLTHEMLVKASKYKGMEEGTLLVDATAGLGEDSLLLAAAGFRVVMFERDIIIAALLRDAMRRGLEDEELRPILLRMELREEDSIKSFGMKDISPEVIYLDPMFPERQKSGLIKKKFQLLQQLESPCNDGEELVNAAISLKPRRIVIKRPLKAEKLAGLKPSFSLEGKAIRYDCVVFAHE